MKKTLFYCAAIVCVLFSGCMGKNTFSPDKPDLAREAEIYESYSYTPEEFGTFLGKTFDDYCNYLSETLPTGLFVKYSLSSFVSSHRDRIDNAVAAESGLSVSSIKSQWTINRYNFTYKSVSYSGEPIVLSASIIVPAVSIENTKHTLDAISLCPPHMAIDDSFCPTKNGTILMGRVMYNHAVVVPDYQGRGVTDEMTYSCLHTQDHSTQAIDAAIAAKYLLMELGYEFKEGMELYNVGVSEGGENSYEIQKQIENDITSSERKFLNLKHTFAANGSLDHVQYVKDKISRVEYSDQETFEEDMKILRNAFDCLTDEEKQGYDADILYSTDVLAFASSTLNANHPVFRILEEAMERNTLRENWNPQTPLRIAGSYEDSTIKLSSHATPAYEMLKNRPDGTINLNVSLDAFHTPVSGVLSDLIGERYMIAHIMADMVCFVHAIEHEDPGTSDIVNYLF